MKNNFFFKLRLLIKKALLKHIQDTIVLWKSLHISRVLEANTTKPNLLVRLIYTLNIYCFGKIRDTYFSPQVENNRTTYNF